MNTLKIDNQICSFMQLFPLVTVMTISGFWSLKDMGHILLGVV